MKKHDIYQVDAFASDVFCGNPAAVIPLESWIPDDVLQNIAIENNLSETAFFVPDGAKFHLRWFTPGGEVDLCGHATLGTAHVLLDVMNHDQNMVHFTSRSGDLYVHKKPIGLMMDFPIWPREKATADETLIDALGKEPAEFYKGHDHMAVFENPSDIRLLKPDFRLLKERGGRGLIVTAPGDDDNDFISRAFFPNLNIDEDPVTGSAHCMLAPYWSERLGQKSLKAHQASARGGDLLCEINDDRVEITGQAALYMKGEIYV